MSVLHKRVSNLTTSRFKVVMSLDKIDAGIYSGINKTQQRVSLFLPSANALRLSRHISAVSHIPLHLDHCFGLILERLSSGGT
jgi:hypothetical protein